MAASLLDQLVTATQEHLAVLGQRRATGMATADWRLAVQQTLKDAHLAAAGLAQRDFEKLTPELRGVVGSRLRFQYDHLAVLALDTKPGDFGAAAMARLNMYGGSARGTFYDVSRRGAQGRGEDQVLNIVGSANSCDECSAESARGWVPADDMSLPGERTCLSNCACSLEFRAAPAAEEAA